MLNLILHRYGMFNAEECYVYEHDTAYQTSKNPVVLPPKSRSPLVFGFVIKEWYWTNTNFKINKCIAGVIEFLKWIFFYQLMN